MNKHDSSSVSSQTSTGQKNILNYFWDSFWSLMLKKIELKSEEIQKAI